MIVLLLVLLVVVLVVAVLLARRRYVWPSKLLREARVGTPENPGPAVVVRRQLDAGAAPENAYAYCYVLSGPGSADEGDHDTDKLVVRVDATPKGRLVTRVAPVDRRGKRTGDSRRLLPL